MKNLRPLVLLPLLAVLPALPGADAALSTAGAPDAAPAVPPAPVALPPAPKAKTTLLPSALTKISAANVPLTPRFQQIRDRIDALFHSRNAPPPPPDPRFNPFRPSGAAPVVFTAPDDKDGAPSTAGVPPNNDLAILQQVVGTLKVRGIVERNKSLQVAINSGPGRDGTYKEKDVISVIVQDQVVRLRIKQITRSSVIFSLNDAEYTLNF